jgi:hypothetical protein|tara:strand:+ start:14009 stop:14377 length:369 start_codon:yes stop_codon:yes gene_type:complete
MKEFNIDSLDSKITKIESELVVEDKKLKDLSQVVSLGEYADPRDEYSAKENYYSHLGEKEKKYQKANDEYKTLISRYSDSYLEMSDFYVGPELNRQEGTFLDSHDEVSTLYFLFVMGLMISK